MKEFLDLMRNLAGAAAVLWILFGFVIGITVVSDESMKPGMRAGDVIVYYRLGKAPHVRDIIVLKKNNKEYVGRVVAAGGDKVEINDDSGLMVNDSIVSEDGIYGNTMVYEGYTDYPLPLASDEYFVLSDSREGSEDSRYYGPVEKDEILGTVIGMYRRGSV